MVRRSISCTHVATFSRTLDYLKATVPIAAPRYCLSSLAADIYEPSKKVSAREIISLFTISEVSGGVVVVVSTVGSNTIEKIPPASKCVYAVSCGGSVCIPGLLDALVP